jgi:DNA-binding CsgD family transcriptional regulator
MSNRVEKAHDGLVRLCRTGLDAWALRAQALPRMQALIPFDCAWFATADPATLLMTGGFSQDIPSKATPLFLENELLQYDVNKFRGLAASNLQVNSLYAATRDDPERSARYRNILQPFGMGDELRIALVDAGLCWGFICLHRTFNSIPFSPEEMITLRALGPHLATGLRNALLLDRERPRAGSEAPGIVTLSDDLSVVSVTANAAAWLEEMADSPARSVPPQAVLSVAATLLAQERGEAALDTLTPRVRINTRAGRWLTLHALRLSNGEHGGEIVVILEPARSEDMAPLLLSAYSLTERERTVAQRALRGMSNKAIGRDLGVSPLTVQQHLKAVFEKVGVHSRGELRARVLAEFQAEGRRLSSHRS